MRCLRSLSAPMSAAAEGGDGQNWLGGNGAIVACGADVSLQCASEQRHRRKTLRLTGMELTMYCAQEDSPHLRSREALRRGRRPLRWRRTGSAAATYVPVGKGRKIQLIPVSLAICC